MNQRNNRLEAIFQAALELPSAEQKRSYLDRACAGDSDLRHELEELLSASAEAEAVFRKQDSTAGRSSTTYLERPGSLIGRYKLLENIGEGGCGVVYMAEQFEPVRRRVALKIIKLGMDTQSVVGRFEAERQALAMMDHPNIARILDAGATETGRPFFVMELVRGVKITQYCDENELSTRDRLGLFVRVCQAVQHAHQKGIIHRDLKPSNILVTINDGAPVPKVIDFGIAKATEGRLTDKTLFTAFQQFLGTPAYMSPEQAVMTSLDIDTRSDIYSLGVLLYEMLAGKTPFDTATLLATGLDEMRWTIAEREPLRPSTRLRAMSADELTTTAKRRCTDSPKLVHLLSGDLDWIVMKCLEKDRTRRYATANGLATDIERHLNHEPVAARPPSTAYRLGKFGRRNKGMVAAAATVGAVLVLGSIGSTWQAVRATRAEREQSRLRGQAVDAQARAQAEAARAEQEKNAARRNAYAASMLSAQADWDNNNMAHLGQILADTQDYPNRGFEWYYWQRQYHQSSRTLYGHLAPVNCVAISPDGKRVVTGSEDCTVKFWAAESGRELFTLEAHIGSINSVAFSPDGRRIVAGCGNSFAMVWDAITRQELLRFRAHGSGILSVAFSVDGQRILTGSADKTAKVWEASTGRLLLSLEGHTDAIHSVAFSPDGSRIVTASDDDTVRLWDAGTGTCLRTLKGRSAEINVVAISPDGGRIAGGGSDNAMQVWEANTGRELHAFEVRGRGVFANPYHMGAGILGLAFSPDGRRILTGHYDGTAKLWDAITWRELRTFQGHTAAITSIAFSPDQRWIVTGSLDHTARLWETIAWSDPIRAHTEYITAMAYSSDRQQIAAAYRDEAVKVREVSTGRELLAITNHAGRVRAMAFSADGRWIATGSEDNGAQIWPLVPDQKPVTLKGHKGWIRSVTFSPDGQQVATASNDRTSRLWAASTGQELATLRGHAETVLAVAFSPDGQRLVTGSGDETARLWQIDIRREMLTLKGHSGAVMAVAFSPEGQRVVTCSRDGTAKLWDATTGRELVTLRGHAGPVCSVAFSVDGQQLVTGSWDDTAKVWDTSTGNELSTLRGQTMLEGFAAAVLAVGFSSDGRQIITGSSDNATRIWSSASERDIVAWAESARLGDQRLAELKRSRDQGRAGQTNDDGAIKQWLVLAPIPLGKEESGREGLDRQQMLGEGELRPRPGDRALIEGREFFWDDIHLNDFVIDFNHLLGEYRENSVAYAVCYLLAEKAQTDLRMRIGSDDQAKVYLNGKQVYESREPRSFEPDTDERSGIQINQGVNVLVFKVVNEVVDWKGSLRLTDNNGKPVKGIKATLSP